MTDQKEIAAATEESGSDSKLIESLKYVGDGFILVDADERIVYAYHRSSMAMPAFDAACEKARTLDDLIDLNVRLGLIAAFDGRSDDIRGALRAFHDSDRAEAEIHLADGSWSLWRNTRTLDGRLLVQSIDVTRLKAREAEIAASEARFRDFAAAASDWFWETDADLRFVSFSEGIDRGADGQMRHRILGKTRQEIADPYEFAGFPEKWAAHRAEIAARQPFRDFTFRYRGADGRLYYINTSGRPWFDSDGRFAGYRGSANDFTELMAVEQARHESEMLFRGAFEQAPGGMALVAGNGRLIQVNDALCRMTGYHAAALQRMSLSELVHPDDRQFDEAWFPKVMRGDGPVLAQERRWRHADGNEIWVQLSGALVHNPQGGPSYLIMHVLDVTDRQRMLCQLQAAKERAEIANRAKSEFLANMSHELRTPLNAVIGFSDTMLNEVFGALGHEKYRDYAASIQESGRHLLAIINDVLDLAKIEAGEIRLDEVPTEPADILEAVRRVIDHRAESRGVTLIDRLPSNLPPVLVDRLRLRQIFLNVLSNAIKFTPAGGTVTIIGELRDDGSLAIVFRDTGIGMSPDEVERAFAVFGQAEIGYMRRNEGTGLGVPFSKRLMELHGGRFEISSRKGAGTTVTLTLPAERVIAPAAAGAGNADRDAVSTGISGT